MTPPTDNDIAEARSAAKGRDIYMVEIEHDGETFYAIITAPKRDDYFHFLDTVKVEDAGKQIRAQDTFALNCTLWPEKKELQKLFEARISFSGKIAGEALKHAGSEAKASSKKL